VSRVDVELVATTCRQAKSLEECKICARENVDDDISKTSIHEKKVPGQSEEEERALVSFLYQITVSHFRVVGGRRETTDVWARDYHAKVTAKPNMTFSQSLVSYLQT
jgi:hypothetical protein